MGTILSQKTYQNRFEDVYKINGLLKILAALGINSARFTQFGGDSMSTLDAWRLYDEVFKIHREIADYISAKKLDTEDE